MKQEDEVRIAKIVLTECVGGYRIDVISQDGTYLWYVTQQELPAVLGAWLENDPGIPIELR